METTSPTQPRGQPRGEETRRSPASAPTGEPRPRGLNLGAGATRVALVGVGFISDFHLEILRELDGVEVTCVCDLDLARARRAADRHGIPHAVGSVAEVSAHADVAHVLVPPAHHVTVARELLELGVAVFCEKPLALSSADGRALVELADERGLPLGVNHNNVFHPSFARLLEAVRRGEVGRVEHVQVTLSVPLRQLDAGDYSHWMFREPRNIVFEQAPHPFSQLVELVGGVREAHTRLLGTRELHPGQPFHDRWLVAARGERATAEVYLAFGQPFTRSTLQVLGTDGALEADLHHDLFAFEEKTPWLEFWNTFLAGWRRGGSLRRSARRGLFYWVRQTLGLGRREDAFFAGMRGSIGAFHAALRGGAPVRVDGRHGVRVLEWCEATVRDLPAHQPPAPLPWSTEPARPGEVLVTGANGFIGRRVLARLVAAGVPVTAACRRNHTLPPEITGPVGDGTMRLVRVSLDDAESLRAALAGVDTVIHLATGGGATWEEVERQMVSGARALGEAVLDAGVKRLVHVSSTAALFLGAKAGEEVSDDVGPDPRASERALYARGKAEAENALLALHAERGLPVVIVRPAVVVGAGTPLQHSGLGLWVRDNHCVGWGVARRPVPLVHVDDVADLLVSAARHAGDELHGRGLNAAARCELNAAEIVAELARATGRALEFHPRPLAFSQGMEVGKWLVKRAGRRKAPFPSYRDLASRELYPRLTCETARGTLGWRPCDDGHEILRRTLSGR